MSSIPPVVTEAEVLQMVEQWIALLESCRYGEAFAFTRHSPDGAKCARDIQVEIEGFATVNDLPSRDGHRVTLRGASSDSRLQRRHVRIFSPPQGEIVGEAWYDLFINEVLTDLTATFRVVYDTSGLHLCLQSIHVM